MDDLVSAKLVAHLQLIVTMVLTLAVGRLLNGLARMVQHPRKFPVYNVHLGWVFTMLLLVLHFWWWEFKQSAALQSSFEGFILILVYAIVFFLTCCLLLPEQLEEYKDLQDYFMSRRKWIFGMLALSFIIEIADIALIGMPSFSSPGIEYPICSAVYFVLCLVAMFVPSQRFQMGFVAASLIYQISYILRMSFHLV